MIFENIDVLNGFDFDCEAIRHNLSKATDNNLIADYWFFKSIHENLVEIDIGVHLGDFEITLSNYCVLLCEEMAKRYFNKYVFEEVF